MRDRLLVLVLLTWPMWWSPCLLAAEGGGTARSAPGTEERKQEEAVFYLSDKQVVWEDVPTLIVFDLEQQLDAAVQAGLAVGPTEEYKCVASFEISPENYEAGAVRNRPLAPTGVYSNPWAREQLRKKVPTTVKEFRVERIWNLGLVERCLDWRVTGGGRVQTAAGQLDMNVRTPELLRQHLIDATTGVWGFVRQTLKEPEKHRVVVQKGLKPTDFSSAVHADGSYQILGLENLVTDRDLKVVVDGPNADPKVDTQAFTLTEKGKTIRVDIPVPVAVLEGRVPPGPGVSISAQLAGAILSALFKEAKVGVDIRAGAARGRELGVFPFVGLNAHRTRFVMGHRLDRKCKWIVEVYEDSQCKTRYFALVAIQPEPPFLAPGGLARVPMVEVLRSKPLKEPGVLLGFGLEGKDTVLAGLSWDINSAVSLFWAHAWWDPAPGFRSGSECVFGFSVTVGESVKSITDAAAARPTGEVKNPPQ